MIFLDEFSTCWLNILSRMSQSDEQCFLFCRKPYQQILIDVIFFIYGITDSYINLINSAWDVFFCHSI